MNPVDLDPREFNSIIELIKKIDFLEGVADSDLKMLLLSIQKQTFDKLKTVLFQGEIANRLFIVRSGSVEISTHSRGTKLALATLTPPMYFGEISLLRPKSATATVTAGDEGAELLILTYEAFTRIAQKMPAVHARLQEVIEARLAQKEKVQHDFDIA